MPEKKYFGTDGIRGKVGSKQINAEFMLKLGWSAGKVLAQKGSATVLIGKDTRISGYMLEAALQAGFSAAGVDILLVGPMPTPAIAYLTKSIRVQAGVVISASHNMYQDNGVKFFDSEGYKLSDDLELAIEEMIDSQMITVESEFLGRATRVVDAPGRYIEYCKNTFPSYLTLKGLKVVVDCSNGATYSVAPQIFHELGAKVIAIANKPNGYNINNACGATDTSLLQKAVTETDADLGVAFDGDGDRVIMVDHQGAPVNGDEILCVVALNRNEGEPKPLGVVGTVMSNLGLEQALQANGIEFERAHVGDRHVLEKLQQNKWQLGGESSGHIVDLRHATTGDGIVTALQVLRAMQATQKPLAELKQVMKKRSQILINVQYKNKIDLDSHPEIKQLVIEVEKSLGNRGRVLLRPSGTEPVIRVMVEGNDQVEVEHAANKLADSVRSMLN